MYSPEEIGKRLLEQDNRMTSEPQYIVQQRNRGKGNRYEYVQVFLTNAGAERYIEENQPDLYHPRIYIASGHHNPEWKAIRKLLAIGEKDIREDIREDIRVIGNQLGLPELLLESLSNWVEHGIVPGFFLQSVISNQLIETIMSADSVNLKQLSAIVQLVTTYLPVGCLGPKALQTWKGMTKMREKK